jgi:hypothetical protein
MTPDIEKYRKYVDQFDLPENHKMELIHIVWRIMESFVDRAFGDDPVQHCLELKAEKDGQDSAIVIDSKPIK